jgi:hypothetical protein
MFKIILAILIIICLLIVFSKPIEGYYVVEEVSSSVPPYSGYYMVDEPKRKFDFKQSLTFRCDDVDYLNFDDDHFINKMTYDVKVLNDGNMFQMGQLNKNDSYDGVINVLKDCENVKMTWSFDYGNPMVRFRYQINNELINNFMVDQGSISNYDELTDFSVYLNGLKAGSLVKIGFVYVCEQESQKPFGKFYFKISGDNFDPNN